MEDGCSRVRSATEVVVLPQTVLVAAEVEVLAAVVGEFAVVL